MEWLEDYTGIGYPFDKYDFVVIPDFQYGGMEHAGATLYNDRRIFLSGHPTTEELMERASLIAHETAHMWFGDYVTMCWFDDVWTKEVFANWFAYRIVRPLFPSINYTLSDLKELYASAYKEDRTRGSNAIWRPLGNLQDAGLIYCNIIYDKAPVVMDKLAEMLGEQCFRDGLREYLMTYGYSNASWDNLVDILDKYTATDLREWSDAWIKEPGMPEYSGKVADGKLKVIQADPSRTHELRLLAFRQYYKSAQEDEQLEELYSIWRTQQAYPALELGESDFTELACQLMVAFPARALEVAEVQSERIVNPDRKESFELLCQAASPDPDVRKSLFYSFLESARNRRPESRVLSALALLCHRDRQEEALAYIVPSLDVLEEIQRTGDIFFPSSKHFESVTICHGFISFSL